jgi:2-hydroxycyclohexanecarboxyl-CoA dehydrogenase
MKLEGQIAVVTGGASGIGKATCEIFAQAGAFVWIADINECEGSKTAEEIVRRGQKAEFLALDVTDDSSIERAAAKVREKSGKLHVLVSAAGWDIIQPFLENTSEYMTKIIALNLMGPVKLAKALVPLMVESGGGKIVTVGSDAGRVGSMGEAVYAGAKGGIIGFTKSLAREVVRYGINVNCVCPGPTDTPLFASQPDKMKEALVRAIPMKRVAKPSEIANAILFFSSDQSSYITGQVLSVSGGLTMVG